LGANRLFLFDDVVYTIDYVAVGESVSFEPRDQPRDQPLHHSIP